MVCLEETGGSLTLPREVMSVWGRLPIRTGQTSPSFVLRWVGIVTSYCPNILDHMPKLKIKAGLPDLPPPMEVRTEWNFCATQGQRQTAVHPFGLPPLAPPSDSASAPKPPTDFWFRPSFGMMLVLEPADRYYAPIRLDSDGTVSQPFQQCGVLSRASQQHWRDASRSRVEGQ